MEELQASNKVHFTRIRIGIGTMLSTIAGETRFGVFEPRAFGVLFRMVLHCAVAQMAGISVVRGSLRSTGTGQTTVTVESDKGFCVHSIVSYRQTTHRLSRP